MSVMVVGLVNAGVIGLRPAISVIMGANIGTTLGNGLIALPLGLLLAGIFALIYIFGKTDKVKNIALYTSGMFKADMPYARADLVASLIEEEDQTASLGETLYQIARRIERQPFAEIGRGLVATVVDQVEDALRAIIPIDQVNPPVTADAGPRLKGLAELRERCLRLGAELPRVERGAILACSARPSAPST